MVIQISAEGREKMERAHISVEDARAVIAHCEERGSRFCGRKPGSFIGHLRIGYVTCWVDYEKTAEEAYLLVNAYSHRIEVGSADVANGGNV